MNEEQEYELFNELKKLTNITNHILNVYKILIILDSLSKNNPNYIEIKKHLLDKLSSLLLLEKNFKTFDLNKDYYLYLIFTRIKNKLSKIELYQGIQLNDEEIITSIEHLKQYQLLIQDNLLDEENLINYLETYYSFNYSLNLTYASILLHEINNNEDNSLFIKMLYEESFSSSSKLEDDLLNNSFNNIPNIQLNIPEKFIKLELSELITNILNNLNSTKNNFLFNQLIILFITYLSYLNNNELNKVSKLIKDIIQDKDLQEELLNYIINIDNYKQILNNKQKHI